MVLLCSCIAGRDCIHKCVISVMKYSTCNEGGQASGNGERSQVEILLALIPGFVNYSFASEPGFQIES